MKKKIMSCILATGLLFGMLSGCGKNVQENQSAQEQKTQNESVDTPEDTDETIQSNSSDEDMHLTLGMVGTDIKAACIIIAKQLNLYEEEGVTVDFEKISNLADGLTAVSEDKLDVLPFGVIPSCSYISQGVDVVIIGGTISEGSEAIVTAENIDKYKTLEDFNGAKIGCFRMETGHMVMKGLLREAGLDINNDVEFIYLDSQASILEAVQKGEVDVGFVNSGYGYIAEQSGAKVAFDVGEYEEGFPCCRQTTSRNCINTKREALKKYEIANLRAYEIYENDPDTAIKALMDYSGQDEAYVKAVMYGTDDYKKAMVISLDPNKKRVSDFYDVMKANGDIDAYTTYDINNNIDVTIYQDALKELMERDGSDTILQTLYKEFEQNNF